MLCLVSLDGSAADVVRGCVERSAISLGLPRLDQWTITGPIASPARQQPQARDAVLQTDFVRVLGDAHINIIASAVGGMRRREANQTGIECIACAVDQYGADGVARLIGDFAFVAWIRRSGEVIAARDALGVRTLYVRWITPSCLAFSTEACRLAGQSDYNDAFMREFLLRGCGPSNCSSFEDVRAVSPGEVLVIKGGRLESRKSWSPYGLTIDRAIDARSAVAEFRSLFTDALRFAIGDGTAVWATLSGGLDSSSIVCTATDERRLRAGCPGLTGTLTYLDDTPSADEADFASTVVRKDGLPNLMVPSGDLWADGGCKPAATDQPTLSFPHFARDLRAANAVLAAGGRVILHGIGPDHYLTGNLQFLADHLANGEVGSALHGVLLWSRVIGRSVWSLGRECCVSAVRRTRRRVLSLAPLPTPKWLGTRARGWEPLGARTLSHCAEERFRLYAADVARAVENLSADLDRGPMASLLDVRYPFLYRPLVAFSLCLSPQLRTNPAGTKWVLREAMRGILPESVRTRRTKGSLHQRYVQSLRRQRSRVDELVDRSILCELGYVRKQPFREAVGAARAGDRRSVDEVMPVLSLETWLAVRHRRWPVI